MKKYILILSLIITQNIMASEYMPCTNAEKENKTCFSCGEQCVARYSETTNEDGTTNNTLTVSGSGDMTSVEKDYNSDMGVYQILGKNITNLVVEEGITNITGETLFYGTLLKSVSLPESLISTSAHLFQYDTFLTDINLPSNLTTIGHAFLCNTAVENITVPESVKFIDTHAFGSLSLKNITIEGDVLLEKYMLWHDMGDVPASLESVYCLATNESCNALKTDSEIGDKITSYTKDSGVYVLEDGTIFASPNDMMKGENACIDLDSCKAQVLKNKGYCSSDESCMAMVDLENANAPIDYKNKSYASIDDLLKGKYMPKRIYTIDEANAVAKPTGNTVRIKYR